MPHINTAALIIGLAVWFLVRFVGLLGFLLMMIKIQKLDFSWPLLLGSALLASALDLIPLVGHFIAVPALYLCIWKSVRCDSFKDATFTVALSYALTSCLTFILLAYAPVKLPAPKPTQDDPGFANYASAKPPAVAQSPHLSAQTPAVVQPTQDLAQTAIVPPNNVTPAISIKGVIRNATDAMATIQCGKKVYLLSQDEDVTISTDEGMVPVHLLEVGKDNVTLSIAGREMKYALN
jgi:hypothetical protein